MKFDLHFCNGQASSAHHRVAGRVEHHGHVHVFEQAGVDHHYLTAAAFFRRSAEEDELAW